MLQLRQVLQTADSALFQRICFGSSLDDQDESLMMAYVAAVCMNNYPVYQHIISRTHNFIVNSDWHKLFSKPNTFDLFQSQSDELALLEVYVLRSSLDKEISFITEFVLDRALLTSTIIHTLLTENQLRILLSLVLRQIKPNFLAYSKSAVRELRFFDIVETCTAFNHKSRVVIELIKLL
jgi:hypothetical protein